MSEPLAELYSRLREGPAVLMLGQEYLRLETGSDPFLTDVVRKYGPAGANDRSYDLLLTSEAHRYLETSLAWMNARSERLSSPEWLKVVASFPWSHVVASAIDTLWYRTFRSDWRELHPIFESKYRPSDVRSRTDLHCTFLFGCVNQAEELKRPPLDQLEFFGRKQEAVTLIRWLPEIVTPFGVLIIEGYSPTLDWCGLDVLLPIVKQLGLGQVHWFNADPSGRDNVLLRDFIDSGRIVPHPEGLATFLMKGEEQGYLKLGLRPEERGLGRQIRVGDRTLCVPPEVWSLASRSATILDDNLFVPTRPVSPDREYKDFLDFLAESSTKPVWSGYRRGFAFQRDYETPLGEAVDRLLRSHKLVDTPVILHGQSGTGKTMALGTLAFKVRKDARCPVLFIERKPSRPAISDLDAFCEWAEHNGAPNTLIIWDGMLDSDQYNNAIKYLTSRGRKAVLVGSCYREQNIPKNGKRTYIEASTLLSPREISDFPAFLNRFGPGLGEILIRRIRRNPDATFLVWLYRILPPTRSGIRSNLLQEVTNAERQMAASSKDQTLLSPTSLGYYLWKSGLISAEALTLEGSVQIGDEEYTEPQELVGLVMVPGRFGLAVPLDVLLRALGKEWINHLPNVLSRLDIFQWHEDASGNYYVGARQPLEAELIVQSRLGSPTAEIAFAKKLLLETHDDGTSESAEIQFAVELVRAMGPNGQASAYFAPYFLQVSDILKELHEERGVENPRLMLQEATLIREYVVGMSRAGSQRADSVHLFDRAEGILRRALDLVGTTTRAAKLRSVILVELGTVLAAKTHSLLDAGADVTFAYQISQAARRSLAQASSLSPEDYHPLDVLAWLTIDFLNSGSLEPNAEAEMQADLLHLYSTADLDSYSPTQRELYHQRLHRIGTVFSRTDLSEKALAELAAQGSKAGYYLQAQAIAGDMPLDRELYPAERSRAEQAVRYLEDHRREIADDSRCLYLLMKLWWMEKSGHPIFLDERQTVPFQRRDWEFVLQLTNQLVGAETSYPVNVFKFLNGLATFHIGQTERSLAIFRELDADSESIRSKRRILRSYLASTPAGEPRVFHGTLQRVNEEGTRGEVWVEELLCHVSVIPRDFPRWRELRRDSPLGDFHIAFNFIGPIADPPSHRRAARTEPT